ncbi:class I SAM-dependent methyltransferase [Hyalangium versicolor]|uniref:class I SAM-dependent methyltransferase n=1 Tax=Hyalangium versicolor TaxID=2861190 RepID=UPI001CCE9F85|nr:class I SAM-dependent methyltransferase [Hyalangium versicolor]
MTSQALAYTDKSHLLTHNYGATEDYKVRSSGWDLYRVNPVSVVDWVVSRLSLEEPISLLDAGCGLGRFALAVAERAKKGATLKAVDLSPAMVDAVSAEARARQLSLEALTGSVQELPYPSGSFDVVLCNYVLYHVESIPKAVEELARVLRPGGRLICMVPSFRWLHELIDWQDRALLRLGWDLKSALFAPTGTDRFCEENAPGHLTGSLRVAERNRYDGTMRFPSVEVLHHHYLHTMRFKNAVAAGAEEGALAATVRQLMQETLISEGRLQVTSVSTCFTCIKD